MKKFSENDIFINTIKAYPKVRIFAHSGSVYYNDTNERGPKLNDFLGQPTYEPPIDCAILAENGYYLKAENNYYLIIDDCEIVETNFISEEGETLITEDNITIIQE